MEMRDRLFHLMVSQSFLSRSTVTDSVARLAIVKLNTLEGIEKAVVKRLLTIEEKYRGYFDSYQKELALQRIAAQTLSQLIHRHQINMQVDTSCLCPNTYEIESEDALIQKFYLHYQVIDRSNNNQIWALQTLRPYVLMFRRECAKLDLHEKSAFIQGDGLHKPIKFFIDLVEELFAYFYSSHLQLDCAAQLLDPMDLDSMLYYQKLLAPNEDFDEYFLHNMTYCKCLRVPAKCPPYECNVKLRGQTYITQAKKKRCARRCAQMANDEVETPKQGCIATERKGSIVSTRSERDGRPYQSGVESRTFYGKCAVSQ
ncbi:uncharacterized protein LOC108109155 [Drosophila eugracilis]|uniref:uncharacterized protein LOC108109155 n=1 Tax=Drosophila eugracilis TaxID=29029 RepID=UPI001BD95822|nr:uncharacterized protein LOC108109155 [Drosophila eugracilis]